MKKLLVLVLVVAVGYFAYQKFVAGEGSEELKSVRELADGFSQIKQQMIQAERAAGVSGMDMTGDAGSSLSAAQSLLEQVQELKAGLSEEKALQEAEELEAEIRAFINRE